MRCACTYPLFLSVEVTADLSPFLQAPGSVHRDVCRDDEALIVMRHVGQARLRTFGLWRNRGCRNRFVMRVTSKAAGGSYRLQVRLCSIELVWGATRVPCCKRPTFDGLSCVPCTTTFLSGCMMLGQLVVCSTIRCLLRLACSHLRLRKTPPGPKEQFIPGCPFASATSVAFPEAGYVRDYDLLSWAGSRLPSCCHHHHTAADSVPNKMERSSSERLL